MLCSFSSTAIVSLYRCSCDQQAFPLTVFTFCDGIASSGMLRCVTEHLVPVISRGHSGLIFAVRPFKMAPLRCLETSATTYPVTHCHIAKLERSLRVSLICWCRSVLQATYRDATMGSGLMEPEGEGRPLLSLQDLESRLVFTRCKVSARTADRVHWLLLNCVCALFDSKYWAIVALNSNILFL